jgi:hypothetical protein
MRQLHETSRLIGIHARQPFHNALDAVGNTIIESAQIFGHPFGHRVFRKLTQVLVDCNSRRAEDTQLRP